MLDSDDIGELVKPDQQDLNGPRQNFVGLSLLHWGWNHVLYNVCSFRGSIETSSADSLNLRISWCVTYWVQ